MQSFTTLTTELQNTTGDNSSAQLTIFKKHLNDTNKMVCGLRPWAFLEITKTKLTVASQQGYQIPNSIQKLADLYVTVGTKEYRPKLVESLKFWNYLISLDVSTSDVLQYIYRRGNQVLFYPTPTTAGSTITFIGRKKIKDLSLADYTTGSIVSATIADETITGTGTSWATNSVGNFIRIDYTNGDYQWYEINSITDTTHLELVKPYEGTTFAAATEGYTIGEFSDIPSDYHNLLVYRPLALYYASLENSVNSAMYWRLYDGGYEAGLSNKIGGMLGNMVDSELENFEGVYLDELQPTELSPNDLVINNRGYSGENW